MVEKTKDWLNNFVEKNAWSMLIVIIGMACFYATVNATLEAQAKDIDDLESAIVNIVQNQKDIIVLQQQQQTVDRDIVEIKDSLKDIKNAMGLL